MYLDSYDSQDYSEYDDGDQSGTWGFTTNPSRSNAAASHSDTTADRLAEMVSNAGTGSADLPNYPKRGNRISVWVRTADVTVADRMSCTFAWADTSNFYEARLDFEGGFFGGAAITSEGNTTDFPSYSNYSSDTWYEVVIEWDDGSTFGGNAGDMQMFLYDAGGTELVSNTPFNDTKYDGTGAGEAFGMFSMPKRSGASTTTTNYFDEATVTDMVIPDPPTNLQATANNL